MLQVPFSALDLPSPTLPPPLASSPRPPPRPHVKASWRIKKQSYGEGVGVSTKVNPAEGGLQAHRRKVAVVWGRGIRPGPGTYTSTRKGLQGLQAAEAGDLAPGAGPSRGSFYLCGEAPGPGGEGGSGCRSPAPPQLLHHNIPRPGARRPRGRAPSGGVAHGRGRGAILAGAGRASLCQPH